ncbi:hypothetical protein PVK06_047598 [Gossypium arboreum]|uniref:Translocon at the inner envelope membrane of chloroplasts 214 n=1 Tax=Gossypium arboreum TaxID=29729 RepID=A0ABR0MDR5_GOSAR|nr:hypothetical protein PVK06_047598 [Gossypium arboreum]
MTIINSVVMVGLYYGFLTTLSIGPSYIFLLRARFMEEGEEGTEKRVSATTGFIASQLMMFISIYYVPLHLALGRIPSPILTKKLKGISEPEEVGESEEERNIEIETISDGGGANQKQGTEENTSSSLFRSKRKKSIGIKEISKKVPRWSYKLIDDLEQQEGENEENVTAEHEIHSRKSKRIVIFTNNQANADTYTNTKDANDPDQTDEVALIRYSQQSDFQHDIIKGSMLAQRRKTITWELFQENVHSPLFLDRVDKPLFFSFDVSGPLKRISRNWICKNKESKISDYTEKKIEKKDEAKREKYKREEKMRIEIAEAWDSLLLAQGMETELPFGFPRKRRSFFEPIFKELKKIKKNGKRHVL